MKHRVFDVGQHIRSQRHAERTLSKYQKDYAKETLE